MLSKEDLFVEIGRSIFIYPLDNVRLLGNSVDLTASRFAWTSDGEYVFDEDLGKIQVPAHKTACILTNEALYVKSGIGGTYHSRVTMAIRGFGHIGTMLDPEFFGQSLIALHNTTDLTLEIGLNERIVSIVFYYLKTPLLAESHKPSPGHIDKLDGFSRKDEYVRWLENNRWANEKRELVNAFKSSSGYEQFLKSKSVDDREWNSKRGHMIKGTLSFFGRNGLRYVAFIFLCLAIVVICRLLYPDADSGSNIQMIATIIVVFLGDVVGDIGRHD